MPVIFLTYNSNISKKNQDPNSRYCQALGPELDSKEGLSCLNLTEMLVYILWLEIRLA